MFCFLKFYQFNFLELPVLNYHKLSKLTLILMTKERQRNDPDHWPFNLCFGFVAF